MGIKKCSTLSSISLLYLTLTIWACLCLFLVGFMPVTMKYLAFHDDPKLFQKPFARIFVSVSHKLEFRKANNVNKATPILRFLFFCTTNNAELCFT